MTGEVNESDKHVEARDRRYSCLTCINQLTSDLPSVHRETMKIEQS